MKVFFKHSFWIPSAWELLEEILKFIEKKTHKMF
jgi:hypothetical protein